ncbi:hypothetical protein [Bacillus sp. FDAARGOS_1420]|uniref:hypothetical protein n=1 Tax=unclassified Bacillus (in: firmicutes) TaxID=185979 RepID=UPI001C5B72BD|nr:hypothetical protein [Bacillus sp. FDAARGOS_1420]MBW3496383.1 hypothetical protein [Bacillus sp. FDAARGOS_1420]
MNDSIMVFGDKHSYDPFSEIELKRKFTLPKELLNPNLKDALLGLNLTYDGQVVFVTGGGVVGVIDRYFKEQVQYIKLSGETMSNSFSLDEKGVEKFEWDFKTNKWKRAWANPDVSSPSVVPMVSAGNNQAYFNGYVDGDWEITGLDWHTGKVKTRLILGDSQAYNGAYSLIQVLPDGDIVYGGLTGYLRINAK